MFGVMKILVIEDEPQMLRNLVTILRAEGFATLGAPGGEEGIALARAEKQPLTRERLRRGVGPTARE